MSKILRMSDRVVLSIGEVKFTLAPMNHLQKQEISACSKMIGGEEHFDMMASQIVYLKHSIKDIEGIKDYKGNDYKLNFEGNQLTDECVSEILNLEQRSDLTVAAWQLLGGIQDLVDPDTGEEMKGVELEVVTEGK